MTVEYVEPQEHTADAPSPILAAAAARVEFLASPDRLIYAALKRGFDVALSLAVLGVLGPVWLFIALLIKLSSRGSVLYRARGVGRHGQPFIYYKFRTMVAGNDDSTHREWIANYVNADQPFAVRPNGNGQVEPIYKVVKDGRVTWLGRYLRWFGLDEVPQFINVLRGEMSAIGPRVPLEYEYAHYDDFARQRLTVLPGITGLAQVRARGTASFSEMLKSDLEYIQRRSLWLDVCIALRTIPVMLLGRGHTG